jgi:hypothetical protein
MLTTTSASRTLLITAAALILAAAFGAVPSHAFKLGGTKWPTRTITYHSSAPQYDEAIRAAVQAWNTSGARIRFKPTSKRRARLRIIYGRNLRGSGEATLGWEAPSTIVRREIEGVAIQGFPVPCGFRMTGPSGRPARVVCRRGPHVWLIGRSRQDLRDPRARNEMKRTVVHELGHILGLKHVRRSCSVMTPNGEATCGDEPQPWEVRCRLLEADDVRGAIRRYGGRLRPLGDPFCEVSPVPAAPLDLTARFVAEDRSIAVTWTNAATPSVRYVRVAIGRDVCPEPPEEASDPAEPGSQGSTALSASDEAGRYCVAVWSEDQFGRLSAPATAWVDVPPESQPDRSGQPPRGEPDGEEPAA